MDEKLKKYLDEKMRTNVLAYAAICEKWCFEAPLAENGYERKTTFYADLSIAEKFGVDAVQDTYNRVMNEWTGNIEYITEFVMALNYKSWEWYARDNEQFAKLYSGLYYNADRAVSEHYADDEKASAYYFQTTD